MPKIQVITDEMHSIADGIGQHAEAIRSSHDNVMRLIDGLGAGFSGSLPSLMIQYVRSNRNGYRSIDDALADYREFIDWAADNYDWNDQQLARWGNALGGRGKSIGPAPAAAGGWDVSGGWDTVGATFPTSRPDLDSHYYKISHGSLHASRRNGDRSGKIDCVYYARARAMEVNGLDTCPRFPAAGSSTEIRSNSVAYFHDSNGKLAHAVYIEHYDTATRTVWFSEGNWGSDPDGELKCLSFEEFKSRNGTHVANYDYY